MKKILIVTDFNKIARHVTLRMQLFRLCNKYLWTFDVKIIDIDSKPRNLVGFRWFLSLFDVAKVTKFPVVNIGKEYGLKLVETSIVMNQSRFISTYSHFLSRANNQNTHEIYSWHKIIVHSQPHYVSLFSIVSDFTFFFFIRHVPINFFWQREYLKKGCFNFISLFNLKYLKKICTKLTAVICKG